MKLNRIKNLVIYLFILLMVSSCVVSKKKYEALDKTRKKSIDSLQKVQNKTLNDYNEQRNVLNENNAKKTAALDSLSLEIQKLTSDTVHLKQNLQNSIAEFQSEKKRLIKIESELTKKSQLIDSLSKTLSELELMINNNKKEVDKLKKIIDDALNAFDATELKVYQKDGKVYVALEEKLMFKSGSAVVDKKGEGAIKKIAEVLEKTQNIDIMIEGHTDNVGAAKLNWELSSKRATAIVEIFQQSSKIDPKRISAVGRGMYVPVATNETTEGKAKNRRIEIVLSPKLEQLYKILDEK